MKALLTILFYFSYLNVFAQKKTFSDCDPFKKLLFVKVENPAKYQDSLSSLKNRIDIFFKEKLIDKKYKGSITINLIINSDGTYCCSELNNTSDVIIDLDDLKNYINFNLKWNSAIQNGRHVGSIKLLIVTFKKHNIDLVEKN